MSQLSKKMAAEAAKPYRVAIYAHLTREDEFRVFEVNYETYDEHWNKLPPGVEQECTRSDFVRISAIATVQCLPLDEDTVTQNAVKSLDSSADRIRTDMLEQLAEIANRKKQLLAITYQGPPEAAGEPVLPTMNPSAAGDPAFDPPLSYSGDSQGSVFDDEIPF